MFYSKSAKSSLLGRWQSKTSSPSPAVCRYRQCCQSLCRMQEVVKIDSDQYNSCTFLNRSEMLKTWSNVRIASMVSRKHNAAATLYLSSSGSWTIQLIGFGPKSPVGKWQRNRENEENLWSTGPFSLVQSHLALSTTLNTCKLLHQKKLKELWRERRHVVDAWYVLQHRQAPLFRWLAWS